MSENLDLVRSIFADLERGDFSATYWAHPQIAVVRADTPEAGQWRGLSGLATAFGEFFRAWDNAWLEAMDYRELDHERVLVAVRFHGSGKASGVDIGQMWTRGAGIYHIRDGQVVTLIVYAEYDRALADLGLVD
jgi:hypothetical protein